MSKQGGPPYTPDEECIADLQAQVERMTRADEADMIAIDLLTQERDEANRQLAAVVEAICPRGVLCGLCIVEIGDDGKAIHDKACVLADLPAAAQEIAAKLERAEKLAATLRVWMETLIVLDNQPKRDELIEVTMQTHHVLREWEGK